MSLKLADTSWKVSATDKTVSGRTWRHGFGFSNSGLSWPLHFVDLIREREGSQGSRVGRS